MPGGRRAARRRGASPPSPSSHSRVVILTTFERDEYVFEALQAGASGFLLKNAPPEELRRTRCGWWPTATRCSRRRSRGGSSSSSPAAPVEPGARRAPGVADPARARGAACCSRSGKSNAELAAELFVSRGHDQDPRLEPAVASSGCATACRPSSWPTRAGSSRRAGSARLCPSTERRAGRICASEERGRALGATTRSRRRGRDSSGHVRHPQRSTRMTAPVEIHDLSKRFGDVAAVEHLSFGIEAGRVTGFLGPNGAGKSTTLRALLGLVRPVVGLRHVRRRPRYEELDRPERPRRRGARGRVVPPRAQRPQPPPDPRRSPAVIRPSRGRRGARRRRARPTPPTGASRATRWACASAWRSPRRCSATRRC